MPVLNKVDLPSAEPDKVAEQMQQARARRLHTEETCATF